MTIDVTVVGGYLGSGKTTLINHLLKNWNGGRIAVLVNDFGRISIDTDLIVNRSGDTLELANGCICCSISGGFASALDALAARPDPPQSVVIEASGVSDPGKVAQFSMAPGFQPAGVFVVVDAENVRRQSNDRYVGTEIRRQLAAADVLVLNKCDLVDATQVRAVRAWMKSLNSKTPIVDAVRGDIPLELFAGDLAVRPRVAVERDERSVNHREHYESWSYQTNRPLERAALKRFVDGLGERAIRGKGFVRLREDPESRYRFHSVGRRNSIEYDSPIEGPFASALVFIAAANENFTTVCEQLARTHFEEGPG